MDITAAQEKFDWLLDESYAANLAYGFDPTPENGSRAGRLNRETTHAAFALHDAREHNGGPCDCYVRRQRAMFLHPAGRRR